MLKTGLLQVARGMLRIAEMRLRLTRTTTILFLFFLFLFLASAPALPAQQEAPGKSMTKPHNHRYTIVLPDPPKDRNAGQKVSGALVRKLAQRRFLRVRQLDVQCCALQLEILSATPSSLKARITLLDVDKQNVFSKEYQAAASGNGRNAMTSAAEALATHAVADGDFLKALAGS